MDSAAFSDISSFCARCGQPRAAAFAEVGSQSHAGCDAALTLEPPRYCRECARRMIVQVTPAGWSARCVEHGTHSHVSSA